MAEAHIVAALRTAGVERRAHVRRFTPKALPAKGVFGSCMSPGLQQTLCEGGGAAPATFIERL